MIVELHGETPSEEFEAISYTFTEDPDEDRLRRPDIDSAHEEAVLEALAAADHTLN